MKSWADPAGRKRRVHSLRQSNSKPKTEEHRRKLGEAHRGVKASEETKQRMSHAQKTRFSKRTRGQCQMCTSLNHTTEEHKARATQARVESKTWRKSVKDGNRARWKKTGMGFRWKCWYSGPKGKICMRSSWEVKFAEKLDLWKMDWEYEPQVFRISLRQGYLPDFYLPEFDLYIEIKGWLRKRDKNKLERFCKKYPEIRWMLLRKDDLEMLGVLGHGGVRKSRAKKFLVEGVRAGT